MREIRKSLFCGTVIRELIKSVITMIYQYLCSACVHSVHHSLLCTPGPMSLFRWRAQFALYSGVQYGVMHTVQPLYREN